MLSVDTIIIGGGISGLACARRLHAAGRDFRLVTDRLGGRMYAGHSPMQNFGATYITKDYRHVRGIVRRGPRLPRRDAYFADRETCLPLYHPRILGHGRALCRFLPRLIEFRRRFNQFRAASPHACQAELLRQDPLLERMVKQPADEFVREHRLQQLQTAYIDPVLSATVFATVKDVNSFYLLAVLLPVLVPTYLADFSETLALMTAGFREHILIDRVVAVEASPRGTYQVSTFDRDLEARNLVVATPAHNTRVFFPELDLQDEHGLLQVPMFALHVEGLRHRRYQPGKLVYLKPDESATVLLPIRPGFDLLFAPTSDPDLSPYYQVHASTARV
jgi:glycine/D-amino acid oxidase-like deaminating enzyme